MASLLDLVSEELTDILGETLRDLKEITWQGSKDNMLRRLRANYEHLTLEQIDAIRSVMGHSHTEKNPCEVCQIMAVKEQQLSED